VRKNQTIINYVMDKKSGEKKMRESGKYLINLPGIGCDRKDVEGIRNDRQTNQEREEDDPNQTTRLLLVLARVYSLQITLNK
jgi:hypothetical protein